MLFGLGLPEWLTAVGLVGGLVLTFRVMARASIAHEEARRRRQGDPSSMSVASSEQGDNDQRIVRKEEY